MKKQFKFYWLLISFIGIVSINAQTSKSEFQKTVDSINAIINANKLAYYISDKQHSEHITRINATQQGMINFTDSIPKPEIDTLVNYDKNAKKRPVLIPDCCPPKNSRTLDLFAINRWDIYFPYAYLKDKDSETLAKFLGFKKLDLYKLKEQFDKLTVLCKKEKPTTK